MSQVNCDGCTRCCRWGSTDAMRAHLQPDELHRFQHVMLAGLPRLKAKPNGDCIYLGTNGCTVHDTLPQVCRDFDCRDLYSNVVYEDKALLIQIIIEGEKRS